jgi:hypothetical protein
VLDCSVATFSCHNVTVIIFFVWIGALAFKPRDNFFLPHNLKFYIIFLLSNYFSGHHGDYGFESSMETTYWQYLIKISGWVVFFIKIKGVFN